MEDSEEAHLKSADLNDGNGGGGGGGGGDGDVFIVQGLPPNFTIGCNATSFNSARPFTGFRDIPPGNHLIWIAPTESASSRSGYWIYTPERGDDTQPKCIHVKEWDTYNEILRDPAGQMTAEVEEAAFQTEALKRNLSSLVPYNLRAASTGLSHELTPPGQDGSHQDYHLGDQDLWYQLTFAIRPDLLNKIAGQTNNGNAWYVTTTDSVSGDTDKAGEARLYTSEAACLRFTFPIDARLINPDATGAERTRQALDPTEWVIGKLEGPNHDEGSSGDHHSHSLDDLTGEFQFAFLMGAHLGNSACLEQWLFLATQVVFRAYALAADRPQTARDLIQTFHAQLVHADRNLDGDALEELLLPSAGQGRKRLRLALTTYRARLHEKKFQAGNNNDRLAKTTTTSTTVLATATPDQHAVGLAFASLESWLRQRLDWDLGGEYVRSGNVMLEDGEIVEAELSDFEDEDERGEFAPAVVEMVDGREAGLLSWDS